MKKTLIALMMVLLCAMLFVSCSNEPKAPYSVGDTVNYGKYPTDYDVEDLRGDAVTWKVLSVDAANSRMLVISEKILISAILFNSSSNSSYSGSSIQSYLNGDFITKYGLSDVKMCSVDVTTNIETTTVGSGDDKVFLLSKTEAENTSYFANQEARIACYTDNSKPEWWLRSATDNGNVYCIMSGGSFDKTMAPNVGAGVRPAFWVNF